MLDNTNTNIPVVQPQTIDGIQLYATDKFTGMSRNGLARFCGVSPSTLDKLLESLPEERSEDWLIASIQDQSQLGFELVLDSSNSPNPSHIRRSGLCASVCLYYASKGNKTAQYSAQKFNTMGIDSWIRQVTGHSQTPALSPEAITIQVMGQLLETQKELLQSQQLNISLQQEVLEKERYITKATINAPGLQSIIDGAQELDGVALKPENFEAGAERLYTLLEWLEEFKYPIPDKMYRQFRLKVAGVFETLRDYTPKKELRYSPAGNPVMAYVYAVHDFHYLDTVFSQVSAAYRP